MRSSKRKRYFGFTLVEVLVSMFILALLSTALVVIYRSGLTEYHHASGRLAMQTQGRLIMDKLLYNLSTAARPVHDIVGNPQKDPVIYPQFDNDSDGVFDTQREIRFTSCSDLLGDGQVSTTGPATAATYRTDIRDRAYRIVFDPTQDNRPVYLEENSITGPNGNGQYTIQWGTRQPGSNPRNLGVNVFELKFGRVQATAVGVQLTIGNVNQTSNKYVNGETMRRYQGGGNARLNVIQTIVMDSAIQLPVFNLP